MARTLVDIVELEPGGTIERRLDPADPGSSVIVLEREGRLYAYRNICPHAGRFLNWAPGRFLFDQGRLVCASHGAVFEVGTGVCVDGPCRGNSLVALDIEDMGDGRACLSHDAPA
jgi:nitrite reductase/ring-hydroxylating ferredoxin subunit